MELTRRDALVALAGGAGVSAAAGGVAERLSGETAASFDQTRIRQLRTVAAVVFPSEVDVTREFIETYVIGRSVDRERYLEGVVDALEALNQKSQDRFGRPVTSLSEANLNRLLRQTGVGTSTPVPDGTIPERIRYYVVNDLLYALYTTPVGGRLVNYENPDGYPGGTEAYQQGPDG